MIVRIVPIKMMSRYARRPWWQFWKAPRMFAIMAGNAIYTHPANIHELRRELHDQGIRTQLDEPAELPDNVFSLDPRKPKK